MPWETQFDIEDTLKKALKVFWKYGYNATSMRDLTKHMGINSGSIYSTFGNKRKLFLSTLQHYNKISAVRLKQYEEIPSPKQAIIRFFEDIKTVILNGTDQDGCFIVNTTLEMAPHDTEMYDIVSIGQNNLRSFFKKLIKKGQDNDEINKNLDAKDTSELLLSLLIGLRVLTRSKPMKKQFDIVINNVESILNSPQ